MSKAKEYRAHAAHCTQRAGQTTDPDVKRDFKAMAQKWLRLAEEVEEEELIPNPSLTESKDLR